MATEDHTGRITLYTVPRRYVVSFLSTLLLIIVSVLHSLGWLDTVIPEERAIVIVEGVLTWVVGISTYMGWAGLASWLRDPLKSTVD